MVCTSNDLQEWKDFPKGLKVLLLEEDTNSSSEIRSKLEAMDYIVSVFCDESEALSAFSCKPECFDLAIVEVNTNNGDRTFKFLETAKELPIIMTSNVHCLSTMMKCIALGAVEFLRKPLSEEKLRNIWQHVVHKAFNAGTGTVSKPPEPVKESLETMLHVKLEKELDEKISMEIEDLSETLEYEHEQSAGSDKYPAPSTPQLNQGARLLDDGDCQDQTNCSAEKESGEQDGESKSVETTCGNSVAEVSHPIDQPGMAGTSSVKEEDSADASKHVCITSSHQQSGDTSSHQHSGNTSSHQCSGDSTKNVNSSAENASKASGLTNSCLSKSSRKKMKIDWTPELHKKFVHAVEQLGVDQAIPSRILELMKVEGLTRHNVASHLQKYRMHKRHVLPKEDDRRWPRPRDPVPRNCYTQRPVMAFPTYHSNHTVPMPPVYPMWGQPGGLSASVQMWGPLAYPPWQPSESWHWQPYPGVDADAWGCPVMPPPHTSYAPYHHQQSMPGTGFQNAGIVDNGYNMPQNSFDLHPAEELIDKVVKEAINKPWLPLPLGLNPPSTDSVLSELSRQGISTIPPSSSFS